MQDIVVSIELESWSAILSLFIWLQPSVFLTQSWSSKEVGWNTQRTYAVLLPCDDQREWIVSAPSNGPAVRELSWARRKTHTHTHSPCFLRKITLRCWSMCHHQRKPFSNPRLQLQLRLRLAWPRGCFGAILCVIGVFAQGFRQEDGAWSRIQSYGFGFENGLRNHRILHGIQR